MKMRYKIWIEKNGKAVFGDGLEMLLEAVDETGSINKASGALHMSYREAWGRIKDAEERLGTSLLNREIGGEGGGGAKLTDEARDLLKLYKELHEEADRELSRLFRAKFGDEPI